MKNRTKIILIIGFTTLLLSIGARALAKTTITKTIESNQITDSSLFEQELEEDGKHYILSGYEELIAIPETKVQTYTSDEKILNSNARASLDNEFESSYLYEDDEFKGELKLKDYKIQEIDNGYQERIDSKYIYFNNLPTNDLEQIAKEQVIQGANYVLINVEWSANSSLDVDGTVVPTTYNGKALYQCVIRTANPKTYKVQAIYEGIVTKKNGSNKYILTYTEKEDSKPIVEEKHNNITPVFIATAGIMMIGIIIMLTNKNATVYNLQKGTLVKLKSKRIRAESVIDITDCENISGNNFILVIKDSSYQKLNGKRVYIQFNKQRKEIILTSHKIGFKF